MYRGRIALAGTVTVAIVAGGAALVAQRWNYWIASFFLGYPEPPLAGRGLVREEDLYGPEQLQEMDIAEHELLTQLARESSIQRAMRLTVGRFSNGLSHALRLEELLRRQRVQHGSANQGDHVEELRGVIFNALFLVAVALKLVGFVLALLIPSITGAYWLLSRPLYVPPGFELLLRPLDVTIHPLEQLVTPLLTVVARVFRLPRDEVFCENSGAPEVFKRCNRVLLGLLVLNVCASVALLLILALLVLLVRTTAVLK